MRRILIDAARRGIVTTAAADDHRQDLVDADLAVEPPADDLLALDEALTKFAGLNRNRPNWSNSASSPG